MEQFITANAARLKQGGIRAFFDKAKGIEGLVNLGIGEPDFNTPIPVIEAANAAMLQGKTHYTANAGDIGLRQEIAKYLARYNVQANPESEIIVTCGAMGALALAVMCTVNEGDEVLLADPHWLNYSSQVRFSNGVPVPVPTTEENGFSIKAADIEKAVTPRSKIILLTTPSNPTGAVLSGEELKDIADVAIRHDLLVFSDEVYCELLYDGATHQSIASLPGMKERTVVFNSFSKSFAMTGWRLGFAAAPRELVWRMTMLQENVMACAPSVAQAAGTFALRTMCGVEEMRAVYEARRNLMVDGLNAIKGVTCVKPKGSFYLFPSIKALGKSSAELADDLLAKAAVAAIPGSAFGRLGEGYLRVSYANSEENLKMALDRMEKFVNSL